MTATITKGVIEITPDLVVGYEVRTETTTVIHELVGGGTHVTDGPDRLRTGTLTLLFSSEEDALAAQDAHMAGGTFALSDTVRDIAMTYVRRGGMTYRLDPDTLNKWLLEVGFQEIEP